MKPWERAADRHRGSLQVFVDIVLGGISELETTGQQCVEISIDLDELLVAAHRRQKRRPAVSASAPPRTSGDRVASPGASSRPTTFNARWSSTRTDPSERPRMSPISAALNS